MVLLVVHELVSVYQLLLLSASLGWIECLDGRIEAETDQILHTRTGVLSLPKALGLDVRELHSRFRRDSSHSNTTLMYRKHSTEDGQTTYMHTKIGVIAVPKHGTRELHRRVRRAINQEMRGFNYEESMALLDRHNDLRSTRSSKDMIFLEWNDELAKLAQTYAEKCQWEHSDKSFRSNVAGYSYIGENLFASSGSFIPSGVVQAWYDEVAGYDYETMSCSIEMCGHYTQVVWAESAEVGCGVKWCPKLTGLTWAGYNVVCHYGPGGNYVGEHPYKLGDACSECPEEMPYCALGMCSTRPKIGGAVKPNSAVFHLTTVLLLSFSFIYYFVR